MGQSVVKNSKKIFSQPGSDPSLNNRVTNLEDNVYKITYYEIVSGTSGSLTIPTGATINEGEFGTSGNSILSKINVEDKPTYSSPLTSGNVVVTANLNIDGTWTASGTYTDTQVALVYSVNIKAIDYHNLDNFYIINSEKLISDSVIAGFVPYTGATTNVDLGEFGLSAGQINLDTSPSGTAIVGSTRWNNTNGISETLLKGGSVSLKNGVDLVARVVNNTGIQLTKAAYQVVKISGAQGQRLAVGLAQANNDTNSADTLGVVIETINNNQEGFIMTVGQLEEVNTTGSLQGETWVDGDVLYLSTTTPGAVTKVKPNGSTGHIVVLGYVEYAHANHGKIYVKIMNGWELEELHDVYIPSYVSNGVLYRDTSTNLWKTNTIPSVLGYTPANDSNVVHITGTETITGLKTFTNNTIIGNASSTNQKQLRIGQGTGWLDIGEIGNNIGLWVNQNTPSTGNVMLYGNASTTVINATSTIRLGIFSFDYLTLNLGRILFTPQTSASSATIPFEYTVPSNTLQTASTNIPNFQITGSNKQWVTGALATQYFNYLSANTVSFTTSSIATEVYNTFSEVPLVGTNATITNAYAFGTNGAVKFDDGTSRMIWRAVPTVPAYSGIFLNVTPNSTNYSLVSDTSGNTFLNGSTNSYISVNATNVARFNSQFQLHTPVASTSGSTVKWQLTVPNDTGLTASTNIPNFKIQGGTKQWAAGTINNQYWNYISANTAEFATISSTITDSYGLYIEKAIAGTNAAITRNWALGLNGSLQLANNTTISGIDSAGTNRNIITWSGSDNISISGRPGVTDIVLNPTASDVGLYIKNSGNIGFNQASPSAFFQFTEKAFTSGSKQGFLFTASANTGQAASIEINRVKYEMGSIQFGVGALTTQRGYYITSPTYSFTDVSTITNAYGLYVEAATAGTNATITNNYGLGVKGQVEFDFDGTGKFFRVKDWSGNFSLYGWGIMTSNDRLRLPNTVYIGDSSYFINRFDSVGDSVGNLYGGAFNVYKDFKAVSNVNNRTYIYGESLTGNVSIGAITNANQRGFRVNQDTAVVDIGSLVGDTTQAAIYLDTAIPSSSNYTLRGDATNTVINTPSANGSLYFNTGGGQRITLNGGTVLFQPAATIGALTNFTFNTSANTLQTASTNIPNFKITGNSKQWDTGNITNQYWNYFTANTAQFVDASTITNSYGLYVESANVGTNATITNNYAAGFGGNIYVANGILVGSTNSTLTGTGQVFANNGFYSNANSSLAGIIGYTNNVSIYSKFSNGSVFLGVNASTDILKIDTNGLTITDAKDIILNTTTGTKIGTSTAQKLGFYNATPIVQPSAVTTTQGIANALSSLGLLESSTIQPLVGLIPDLKGHEVFRGVKFRPNSTTIDTEGGITNNLSGTQGANTVAITNYRTRQITMRFEPSTVTTGNYCCMRTSAALWSVTGGFLFTAEFGISDSNYAVGAHNFWGLTSSIANLAIGTISNLQPSALTNIIAVANDSGDTNLQIMHNDATGTATKIDLGVDFPSNRTAGAVSTTMYHIRLYNAPGSTEVAYIVINKETGAIAEGVITTNLPDASTLLAYQAGRSMGTGGGGVTGGGRFDVKLLGVYNI